jgi:hypothetical protein
VVLGRGEVAPNTQVEAVSNRSFSQDVSEKKSVGQMDLSLPMTESEAVGSPKSGRSGKEG